MTDPGPHPDDDVTDPERAYGAAFVSWMRRPTYEAECNRENAFELLLHDAATRRDQRSSA